MKNAEINCRICLARNRETIKMGNICNRNQNIKINSLAATDFDIHIIIKALNGCQNGRPCAMILFSLFHITHNHIVYVYSGINSSNEVNEITIAIFRVQRCQRNKENNRAIIMEKSAPL